MLDAAGRAVLLLACVALPLAAGAGVAAGAFPLEDEGAAAGAEATSRSRTCTSRPAGARTAGSRPATVAIRTCGSTTACTSRSRTCTSRCGTRTCTSAVRSGCDTAGASTILTSRSCTWMSRSCGVRTAISGARSAVGVGGACRLHAALAHCGRGVTRHDADLGARHAHRWHHEIRTGLRYFGGLHRRGWRGRKRGRLGFGAGCRCWSRRGCRRRRGRRTWIRCRRCPCLLAGGNLTRRCSRSRFGTRLIATTFLAGATDEFHLHTLAFGALCFRCRGADHRNPQQQHEKQQVQQRAGKRRGPAHPALIARRSVPVLPEQPSQRLPR